MKLQYLGTAAAEGWPALFCECDHCKRSKMAGGRNIRTRSQALIDDTLVIDFPPDTYMHILCNGLDAGRWTGALITHAHSDHFYASDFAMHRPPFSHGAAPMEIYLNRMAAYMAKDLIMESQIRQNGLSFHVVDNFVPFRHARYEITPLHADHDAMQDAHFYIISDGSRSLLYAHDTGFFPEDTWTHLKDRHFDCVSLDCTYGALLTHRNGHMAIDVCAEVVHRLEDMGCINAQTRRIVNHFSHNSLKTYDELLPMAEEYGLEVSYDGMIVEF